MAVSTAVPGTFRDPAGSLTIDGEGQVLRRVRPAFVSGAKAYLESPLAQRWMADGRMIPTALGNVEPDGTMCLTHERVEFPTYPWEWTPGQWAAAAELTLDMCEEALGAGLILKDATPLNVLFRHAQPVFVDVLSFDRREPGDGVWLAYGQFVRTFLLPLAANRYLGWSLSASMGRRDGYEPADLYPYLPLLRRMSAPLLTLVTLPHLLEKKAAERKPGQTLRQHSPEVALHLLRRTLAGLRRAVRTLTPPPRASRWSHYTSTASHYGAEDHADKAQFVRESLAFARPTRTLDVGGNTGFYSRLAAEAGSSVIAWDTDVQAADANWHEAFQKHEPILPVVADIARPTPAVGWHNTESLSLLARSRGAFDAVMLLGVIHHLLLIDQIPMAAIFDLVRSLTKRWAIIEWIPATDSQFQQLCRGRQALYGHLDQAGFLAASEQYFERRSQKNLLNGRTLWLFELR
jgi:SAM-dependent methyltransferase